MTTSKIIVFTLIFVNLTLYVSGQPDYSENKLYWDTLTQPKEATISLKNLCIYNFTADKTLLLMRYFSCNPKWKVRQEYGKTYAIMKEKKDEKYITSRNGSYYNDNDTVGQLQTMVIVSFGQYYGSGTGKESRVTYTDSKSKELILTVESEYYPLYGSITNLLISNSSYLIIKGDNINIEIFERAINKKRNFTQKVIQDLNNELSDVLKFEKEILENGKMPNKAYYPFNLDSTYFDIVASPEIGKYVVLSGLKVDKEGTIYTKIFDSKTNKRLAADGYPPTTTIDMVWSKSNQIIFQYESEITVYENDYDNKEARFEIWFIDKIGHERKLLEKSRQISAWAQ